MRTIQFWQTNGDLLAEITIHDNHALDVDKIDAVIANEITNQIGTNYDCSSELE